MDPITHMTLGACLAMAVSPAPRRRAAALAGAIAGLLPDADVFLRSNADPLMFLEYHRHFTHGWVVQPLVAAVAWFLAAGLHRARRRDPARRAQYGALILPAFSHPFCDLWTSYGTHVTWPFSLDRSALDWISVVDPLMTLPLLIACAFCMFGRTPRWLPVLALLASGSYLTLAVVQKGRATESLQGYLAQENLHPDRVSVRPTFANTMVWRATWSLDGRVHCGWIRTGQQADFTAGESAALVHAQDPALWEKSAPEGSVLRGDIRRFEHFSDGWLIWHPDEIGVLGDARYSMRPDRLKPIWGIRLGDKTPDQHATFETYRSDSRASFSWLWSKVWLTPSAP